MNSNDLSLVKAPKLSFSGVNKAFAVVNRRNAFQVGLAIGLGLAGGAMTFAQDLPPVQTDVWRDASRNRDIPVLVRWPGAAPVGVVVYSHGLGGKKEGGDVWGEAWAAAGLVVVHLQHPGSDAASLKGGFSALRKAMQPEQLAARVGDVRFVTAEIHRRRLAGGTPWGSVPANRLALAGHSFGARSTLVAAGWQRAGVGGADPQPKAFIALSPALGADVSLDQARQELSGITRPVLVCTGSLDGEILNNGETPQARRMVYDALPAGKKALLWLDLADHFTFAGNNKQIPSTFLARRSKASLELEDSHHALVAKISANWLREQLIGQPMESVTGLSRADQWLRG
jgi:predicted dienelactone hydrolase